MVYLPIFTAGHWIAGILTVGDDACLTLTIRDSAPNEGVHRALTKRCRHIWPGMRFTCAVSPQQCRGSDDCGLHMLANIFGDYCHTPTRYPSTIARRLRKYFAAVAACQTEKGPLSRSLWRILRHEPTSH